MPAVRCSVRSVRQQPALAGQPCGLGLNQAAGLADVDSDQLGADRGGDLRGSPQDVLTLWSAGQCKTTRCEATAADAHFGRPGGGRT